MPSLQRLENLFRLLLPPASREHVLGDLHEKYNSPRQYVMDAISVLGPVIVSRIRRTTDFQVFLMEIFAVYMSFSAAAWWLGETAFLYDHIGFARLAIPTTVTVVGLLMCNAYADPEKASPLLRPILESAGSISVAFLGQAVIFDTRPSFAVPFAIMLFGSCMSFVLVSTLRVLFPPILSNRSKIAVPKEPRIPQQPNLVPVRLPLQQIRQTITDVQSPIRWKIAAICAAALLVAALLASTIWHATERLPSPGVILAILVFVFLMIYQIRTRE